MCGIIGVLGGDKKFKLDLNTLNHRGPDSKGLWQSPEGEFPALLGHTRLSIIGIDERGAQPMVSDDGRYLIVFNGEIYNFIELRTDLKNKGYVFQTETDTEVLLYGLINEGPSFMLKCNGMWSYCLWDRMQKRAIFGRDRFGKKPFFYSMIKGRALAFASEMKALYPYLDSVQPSESINENLIFLFNYEHTENCVVRGVKRLPAGHWAEYDGERIKLHRWWNTLDHLVEPPSRYEDQVEQWRALFLDAVRLRMRSDVPIGTALSGGLDSSATFCAMSYISNQNGSHLRESKDWQHGFCAHYPGSSLDELTWAKFVTDSLGVKLETVEINPLHPNWTIERALYQVEDPYLTFPLPMLATYQEISKAGIKVTLDGHGADELFSGYGHLCSLYSSADPKQLAELIAIQKSTMTGELSVNDSNLKLRWFKNIILTMLRSNLKFPKNLIKAILGRIDWRFVNYELNYQDQYHPAYLDLDPLTKQLYEIFHITILPTLLRNYDRYSMASGVEIRMPFMDWRLVTFTFSLPWTSKVGGGFTKRIMRDALKGILPEEIRNRRDKIGWNAPLHEWFKGPFRDELAGMFNNIDIPDSVRDQWDNFQRKTHPQFVDGQSLWAALMPYLWRNSLKFRN